MLKRAPLAPKVVAVLSSPPFLAQVDAQAIEPSVTFARAGYKDSCYTDFIITSSTPSIDAPSGPPAPVKTITSLVVNTSADP